MKVKIQARASQGRREEPAGRRPVAWLLSALLHGAVVVLLIGISAPLDQREPSEYEQFIAPHRDKIIWYPLKTLPLISAQHRIGTSPTPSGEHLSKNTMLSLPTVNSGPGKQLVWRPDTPKRLEHDVAAPNMIAVERKHQDPAPVTAPAPAPEKAREETAATEPVRAAPAPVKQFVAPEARVRPPAPVKLELPPPALENNPALPENADQLPAALAAHAPRPLRKFAAPERKSAASGAGQAADALPLPDAPVAPAHGGSQISALVLNLGAATGPAAPVPEGNRPAVISAAPRVGPSSSGADQRGAQLAGIVVKPGAGVTPDSGSVPERSESALKLVYPPASMASLRSSFSAPLPPSARHIPAAIEERFRGRVVYTMVLPMRRVTGYAGDWILWFAERDQDAERPQMRAPLPLRKVVAAGAKDGILKGTVQLAGIIRKDGRVDALATVQKVSADVRDAAIQDLASWEFLPALRNREFVDVDIVMEIAFPSEPRSGTPSDTAGSAAPLGLVRTPGH